MSTKVNILALAPRNATENVKKSKLTEIASRDELNALLAERTIITSDRFVMKPGHYEFDSVEGCHWIGDNGKKAVLVVITFKDGSRTSLGTLRKINHKLENFGPEGLPITENELLSEIEKRGIHVTEIVNTKATDFVNGERTLDPNDESGYKTKPAKIMRWTFDK